MGFTNVELCNTIKSYIKELFYDNIKTMLVQHINIIDELNSTIDLLKLQLNEINDTHTSNVIELQNITNSTSFIEIVKQESPDLANSITKLLLILLIEINLLLSIIS